ncbi:TonB-dependent receptor [Sphingomonas sp. 28-63-12]|uniref:TonB-dependent receptor n=1 Tax=Sphingomonas sp. 28-63-12 TaxID=1970434 RepID=UPI000BCDE823|nr:MAG: TonB-dependent receptor [Sphingomonas sp. 28-63-12]
MLKTHLMAACACSVLAFGLASPAAAQQAPSTPAAESAAADSANDGEQSNDIVVTAQGRQQILADVPIAVTAVNAASLERSGANDIRQLNQLAPSLLVSSTGNEANGSARLRGIGTVGDNPGLESSVAVFVDGVYRSRSGVGLNELGDIERIEVLRGPQGTLFGRNASAGIISVTSKLPSFTASAGGEISYGNYNFFRVGENINVPITDTVAARLDGVYVRRDGFYNDVTNGGTINNRNRYFIRGQLLYQPSADLSFRLIGDYTRRNESCCAAAYIDQTVAPANLGLLNPTNPIIGVLTSMGEPAAALSNPYSRNVYVTPGRSYAGQTQDWGISGQLDYDFGGVKLTSITAYRGYYNYQGSDTDYSAVDILYRQPGPNAGRREFATFSQELRLQGEAFDGHLDWLVGGYFANEDLTVRDNLRFGTQYGAFASCRLLAAVSGGIPRDPTQAGCRAGPNGAVTDTVLRGIFGPLPNQAQVLINGLNLLSTLNNRGETVSTYQQNSRNFAFFTHNIVSITDSLKLTLGARYTNETKTLNANFGNDNTVCQQAQALLLPYLTGAATTTVPSSLTGGVISLSCQGNSTAELNGVSINDKRQEGEFTGTAILSYKVTPDLLVYGSWARGYKAGGFNLDRSALKSPIFPFSATPGGAQALVKNLQFDQEINTAYEVGAKYSTRHFSINVAAFRQEFKNFQLNTFNGSVFLVQTVNSCSTDLAGADRDLSAATGACAPGNVRPGVISQGVEFEASITPIRDFTVNAGVTYADTRYQKNLIGNQNGSPLDPALRLLPGDNLSNAPQLVVTSAVSWTPKLGNSGLSGLFYVDGRLTGDYNTGSDLFPQKEQDGFVTVNARIGIRGPSEKWSIEFWGQNVLNTNYTQVAFNTPFQQASSTPSAGYPGGTQIFSAFLAEPRTYGITLRGKF